MGSDSALPREEIESEAPEEFRKKHDSVEDISLPKKVRKSLNPKLSQDGVDKIVIENRELGMRLAWSLLKNWRVRIREDEVVSAVGASLVEGR